MRRQVVKKFSALSLPCLQVLYREYKFVKVEMRHRDVNKLPEPNNMHPVLPAFEPPKRLADMFFYRFSGLDCRPSTPDVPSILQEKKAVRYGDTSIAL